MILVNNVCNDLRRLIDSKRSDKEKLDAYYRILMELEFNGLLDGMHVLAQISHDFCQKNNIKFYQVIDEKVIDLPLTDNNQARIFELSYCHDKLESKGMITTIVHNPKLLNFNHDPNHSVFCKIPVKIVDRQKDFNIKLGQHDYYNLRGMLLSDTNRNLNEGDLLTDIIFVLVNTDFVEEKELVDKYNIFVYSGHKEIDNDQVELELSYLYRDDNLFLKLSKDIFNKHGIVFKTDDKAIIRGLLLDVYESI